MNRPADGPITPPWNYTDKQGTSDYSDAALFEGGVNISLLNLDIGCGGTFLANTRASQSTDARLHDFAIGDFDLCGSKSGTKYEDPNGDGDLADGVAASGWTIKLYADDGTTAGALDGSDTFITSDVTDGSGNYSFDDLLPGDYIVCEETMTDWVQTFPKTGVTDATDTCDVVAGHAEWGYAFTIDIAEDETGNDFGNFELIDKSGTKFEDPNGDGDLADGVAASGWTINIYEDDGDGVLDAGDTETSTVTDGSGNYTFGDLGPGTYFVCEETMTDWVQTFPNTAAGEVIDTCDAITGNAEFGYKFTASSGVDETGNDFGNFRSRRAIDD